MKNQAILNKKYAPNLITALMIHDEKLSALSGDAKLIYMSLYSQYVCNAGSMDSKGQQYLICTRKDMEALINKSDKPVAKAVKSLVDAGLIMEFKRGKGLPNVIYLCQISDSIASLEAQCIQNSSTEESTGLSTDLPESDERVGEMPIHDDNLTESDSDTCPTPYIYINNTNQNNTNSFAISKKRNAKSITNIALKSKSISSHKNNKDNKNNKNNKGVVSPSLSSTTQTKKSSSFQELIIDDSIYSTFVASFNFKPTPAIKRVIISKLKLVDHEVLMDAMQKAGYVGKDWGYALGILKNWLQVGVRTGEDLANYEFYGTVDPYDDQVSA